MHICLVREFYLKSRDESLRSEKVSPPFHLTLSSILHYNTNSWVKIHPLRWKLLLFSFVNKIPSVDSISEITPCHTAVKKVSHEYLKNSTITSTVNPIAGFSLSKCLHFCIDAFSISSPTHKCSLRFSKQFSSVQFPSWGNLRMQFQATLV